MKGDVGRAWLIIIIINDGISIRRSEDSGELKGRPLYFPRIDEALSRGQKDEEKFEESILPPSFLIAFVAIRFRNETSLARDWRKI